MEKTKISIEIELTPGQMAEAFRGMDSGRQAEFFVEIVKGCALEERKHADDRSTERRPFINYDMQWLYVGHSLRDDHDPWEWENVMKMLELIRDGMKEQMIPLPPIPDDIPF